MTSVYIIADIEGSTGCHERADSQLFNDGWVRACVEMTRDVDAIGRAVIRAGASKVRIKDFHRTGYNIFTELLDKNIEIDQGYKASPIPGIGEARNFDRLFMVGMHAASGTEGFLPHTLTSKFSAIMVNGQHLGEAELFASSVASVGLVPTFFSGCEKACKQAQTVIPGLTTFTINKPLPESAEVLRNGLAQASANALAKTDCKVFDPVGPFETIVMMRDGEKVAEKLRRMWKLEGNGNELVFSSQTMNSLYWQLIQIAYLTPFTAKHLHSALFIANISGRLAHVWARRRAKNLRLF